MPPISYYHHSRPFPGVELIIEIFDLQLFITTSVVSNVLSQWACSWWVEWSCKTIAPGWIAALINGNVWNLSAAIWMDFILASRWTMSLSRWPFTIAPSAHTGSTYLRIGLIINTLGYLVWTMCHNNNNSHGNGVHVQLQKHNRAVHSDMNLHM